MHGKCVKILVDKLKGMDDFKELGICGRLILKMNRKYSAFGKSLCT
jgi:hypothetical protein